ncbi:phenylalanyl-tRNA synthetase beta chain [Bartonella bacilliformis str. Heidi Mejia]|uniref:Phenylalanine--tRNA ligase beta subunit n=2 Tax=Bartonella bacilliformis TaxID=774 RepID=A1UUA7_BARBK|nr:phenylalanine--tRNA ligase subunit beta [Bartonella bacilliformis]ABM45354.1 phenylalanyl-tRNA synthetase, beta subunit [Bartonella bacilliformis KC583]AMG86278.1 phenylalanine--tRNA ligase subunit beta [Bartonella bacilliformis]EKS43191.1 phenylalanyl-tRNA ligase subunit beta [Bartonella bacilliformis INS]EYS88922.1 phenylalanyl-tRNA synthetase beta chain [Bartonella bacilliformis San Pedro600-02]EYS90883.1 phenylalanyl-tRNA synthetase beta chain [Bartonella bacilliformis str. Heidi Mejia]
MKFTLSWLRDHLETNASLDEICDKLTAIGLEVDHVDCASLEGFVIAKVLTAAKHPDADKLQILSVDTGAGTPIQVVCGAKNARVGLVSVLALPGTYVPGLDITLSVGKIRGVESFGMMCSQEELKLPGMRDGIIELPEDAPVGAQFATYAGLDDPVIDVGLTPNRSDCTGVRGIARDLAAAGIGRLKELPLSQLTGSFETSTQVSLDFSSGASLCLGFAWCEVRNVKNGASPQWMQQRLIAIGLRPINALVDITNYMTFDLGRPLHVFDADKVKGVLKVRRGFEGEQLQALNGKIYNLGPQNCVIADDEGVVSIAGIMGGKRTSCDEMTHRVIIESALWDSQNIAQTGRALGLISDARYRFERGVDPAFMESGLEIATELALRLCGGEASMMRVIGYQKPKTRQIVFPFSEIKRLTNLEIDHGQTVAILTRLGFSVAGEGDVVTVTVPTWRSDVVGKADLVEEVMRIYGLNKIEPMPLENFVEVKNKILTFSQICSRSARWALACRGMMEAVTWSFISESQACAFGGGQAQLKLANPIAVDMSVMRPSLLPGLLMAAQRNADRGFADLSLFEISNIYEGDTPDKQQCVAAGIRRETEKFEGAGRFWAGNAKAVDVFDAKADAFAVLTACGVDVSKVQIEVGAPNWYHPGCSGVIKLGPKIILGFFGTFHPDTLETLDVSGRLCGFEIFLDRIPEPKKKATKIRPALKASPFQMVRRDFAFVVDKTVSSSLIIRAASAADKKFIHSVQIFDLFEDLTLGEDKKSVAIEVAIQPVERTLTDEDLEALASKVVDNVTKMTGAYLRG